MRLRRFEIRNYKCIEHVTLEWEDLIVLIGEKNAGKSSVLSAIAVFLNGSSIKDSSLFRRHQTDDANAIELVGHFDSLTDEEKGQSLCAAGWMATSGCSRSATGSRQAKTARQAVGRSSCTRSLALSSSWAG